MYRQWLCLRALSVCYMTGSQYDKAEVWRALDLPIVSHSYFQTMSFISLDTVSRLSSFSLVSIFVGSIFSACLKTLKENCGQNTSKTKRTFGMDEASTKLTASCLPRDAVYSFIGSKSAPLCVSGLILSLNHLYPNFSPDFIIQLWRSYSKNCFWPARHPLSRLYLDVFS